MSLIEHKFWCVRSAGCWEFMIETGIELIARFAARNL